MVSTSCPTPRMSLKLHAQTPCAALGAFVPSYLVDFRDRADPDYEPRHLLPKWMSGLAVEQSQGFTLDQTLLEEQVYQRLLSRPAEDPSRREGWFFIGWQRIG